MYKVSKSLSPPIVTELFKSKFNTFVARTVYHGSKSISFLSPKIWKALPDKSKTINSIKMFILETKK